MARFAFCKEDDSLVEACRRLTKLAEITKQAAAAAAPASS